MVKVRRQAASIHTAAVAMATNALVYAYILRPQTSVSQIPYLSMD